MSKLDRLATRPTAGAIGSSPPDLTVQQAFGVPVVGSADARGLGARAYYAALEAPQIFVSTALLDPVDDQNWWFACGEAWIDLGLQAFAAAWPVGPVSGFRLSD